MSRKKNHNPKGGLSKSLPGLLLLLLVLYWAWQRYNSPSDQDTTTDTPAAISTAAEMETDSRPLEMVKVPKGTVEEILEYPGFTVSFNSKYKQPNYVVWELTRDEVKSHVVKRRTDNFAVDSLVNGCATLDDYLGSHYDRGHMAPAADMKWSEEAMEACFLLTNMSPQRHSLNSKAWNTLEERCRDWAVRDSAIVIICGPVLTDAITKYIGKSRVAVPERFFKVVLAPYANPPRGIGFVMPNGYVNGGLQTTAVAIDEIEEITGFDFFNALPDDIENKIEAENHYPRWTER